MYESVIQIVDMRGLTTSDSEVCEFDRWSNEMSI